jgi:hypothetical protein
MRLNICLAALAATLVASPAFAQAVPTASDTASAEAKGVVLQAHKLVKNKDLDFGVVTVDSVNGGTVSISADSSGTRTTGGAGGVTPLPSTFQAANFDGLAAPGETVQLTLTPPAGGVIVSTTNANDKIAVTSLDLDAAGPTRVTDTSGQFAVYVGGTFTLNAGQNAGVYTGQFDLKADYQ